MITRSKVNKNEGDNQDSNKRTSISSSSTINNSNLIDLNTSDSSDSNWNKTFVEKQIAMAATLNFGDSMKSIPSFSGGSEGY